jgi:uncharacterized protein
MSGQIRLGSGLDQYRSGDVTHISFVVTEECNLRCRYCYEAHKNPHNVMPREVACQAIDFFLGQSRPKPAAVLEFMGGEPTLEMDLIFDIVEYFRDALSRQKGHPWQSGYLFVIGSNGTTYGSEKVQRFYYQHYGHAQLAITIDGTKRKHDMHRVYKDGRGSYDLVAKNARLWIREYPYAITKVTFSSDDLQYVCESILHLWDMGIKDVAANVVFENVWKPDDPRIFEAQLRELADKAIENDYWRTHNTTLFWAPLSPKSEDQEIPLDDSNWCGTGTMVSVDAQGNLYPCVRFHGFSIANPSRSGRPVGNIYRGFDRDKLRAFHCLRKSLQSTPECMKCTMQYYCSWCSGFNYDAADSDTIFQRMTYICEMHKAQWRANDYYWEQMKVRRGLSPEDISEVRSYACSC